MLVYAAAGRALLRGRTELFTWSRNIMVAKPLAVLLAADDPQLVRHASRFLTEFGYEVLQAATPAAGLAAWQARRPPVVIIDEGFGPEGADAFCREVRSADGGEDAQVLLLGGSQDAEDVTSALEAGFDDFLIKPVVYGEFLARLRATARLAEVDRRVTLQSRVDPLTGLANRAGFHEGLRHALAHRTQTPAAGLVLVDVDWFARIAVVAGQAASDAALVAVAKCLKSLVDSTDLVARWEGDRFAVWLSDGRDQDAAAWAELARNEIAKLAVGDSDHSLWLTVSCGVVGEWDSAESADSLLERAEQALLTAKRSGRNAIAFAGDHAEEDKQWTELAAPGKLFEDTTARDVMTPCATVLHADDTLAQAAAKFRRTGAGTLAVTDKSGAIVGLLSDDVVAGLQTGRNSETRRVRDVMSKTVPRYQPETPFCDLMDFFVRGSGSVLVVVEKNKPVGMVSRTSITSLIEPVRSDTFAPEESFSRNTEFLIVAGA